MGLARFLLALIVAGDHLFVTILIPAGYGTRGVDQWVWFNAGFAVYFFYIISGFLISYVLAAKYQTDTTAFYRSRFIRIFSLYWPLLIIAAVLWHSRAPQGVLDRVISIVIIGADWTAAFGDYPNVHVSHFRVLAPAWSISAELTFYLMAPWLLRRLPMAILAFCASFVVRIYLQWRFGFMASWSYFFFPGAVCFFLAGHLARVALDRWPAHKHQVGPAGFVLAIMSVRLTLETGSWMSPWFYVGAAGFAASLPWLFAATKDNPVLNYLGDLSYPLYLTHSFVVMLLFVHLPIKTIIADYGAFGVACFIAADAAMSIVAAAAAHRIIERPFARVLDGALTSAVAHYAAIRLRSRNVTRIEVAKYAPPE